METYNDNENENENDEVNITINERWRQNYLDFYDVESNIFYAPIVIDNSNLNHRNMNYSNIVTAYIKTDKEEIEDMKKLRRDKLKNRICSNCNNCCLM